MKITEIETFAVGAGWKNWLFVKVHTDKGFHGIGEGTLKAHDRKTTDVIGMPDVDLVVSESKRVLELNGEHAAVKGLRDLYAKNSNDPRLEAHARLLYEQAVIAEGSKLKDPSAFAKRINELIAKDLGNG